MTKSVTVKAAWIGGAAVVLAAVIAGLFSFFNRGNGKVSQEIRESPQSIQAGRDVNIHIAPDRPVPAPSTETPLPKKQIASIEFQNARPFVDRVVLGNESWRGYIFKVQIQNNSLETTLHVKHLKLTDLRKLEGKSFKAWEDAEPVYLEWDRTKPMEIPPQDKVLVPFARIYPPELQRITDSILSGGVDIPQLRFTVLPGTWPRRMTSHIPQGTHRFKIHAFFENVPPAEVELELNWTGAHRESVEAMAKDIQIRKL